MASSFSGDLSRLGAGGLVNLYRDKKLSPLDVTVAALDRVRDLNLQLNALCWVDEKAALAQARASARRWQAGKPLGTLDGVPVTVKDWFHVKGWPTRYGARLSSSAPQKEDSPAVARLREAGAVFIGKTTLPEYGHKGVTDSPLYGVTRNPWDEGKTCGGSSGGAAVCAATGMGVLHLGSDAGGSVRIPASFCGVAAFKPSPGVVPSWPPSLFSTLSAAGPIARSIDDCARMLDVIAQFDKKGRTPDWHALPLERPDFAASLGIPLGKLKIAYAPAINDVRMNADVAAVMKKMLPHLQSLGRVDVIRLDVPDIVDVFNKHWMAVAAHMLKGYTAAQKKKTDARLLHWAARGEKLALHDYLAAERARMDIGAYFKSILDDYDILVTPTTAMAAFDAGVNMPRGRDGKLWDDWTPFTYGANLARLPAATIPAGLTKSGLPVGVQVMAGYLKDTLALRAAAALEKKIGFAGWGA
ncbi:MAG TPA: amidase [Alphaproteobacteria bacterium]|nr:amidase [Alphaproteobacteria bacterium]